jgi:hypothetical protein
MVNHNHMKKLRFGSNMFVLLAFQVPDPTPDPYPNLQCALFITNNLFIYFNLGEEILRQLSLFIVLKINRIYRTNYDPVVTVCECVLCMCCIFEIL